MANLTLADPAAAVVLRRKTEIVPRMRLAPHDAPQPLTRDVACLQLSLVNVYFYGHPLAGDRGWVLIDAGLAFSEWAIRNAAEQRYGTRIRPAAIVLTHGHFDHVGAVKKLAKRWDVPVYAHPLELPYLTGRSSYPPPDPTVGGGAMSTLSRLYPRGPIDLGTRVLPLPADGSVPHMPGWRWIHTPGHTAGHISLFRAEDRTLIAGDAFVTQRQESLLAVLRRSPEISRPPAYYTSDWQAAGRSVERLARLQPNLVATGHGSPLAGPQMRRELEQLARQWQRDAVPAHGRYVPQPAIADTQGVRFVPPAATDTKLLLACGLGLVAAGALAYFFLRQRLTQRK